MWPNPQRLSSRDRQSISHRKNMQEEALIEHIVRVKAAGASTNAEVHAALLAEGIKCGS